MNDDTVTLSSSDDDQTILAMKSGLQDTDKLLNKLTSNFMVNSSNYHIMSSDKRVIEVSRDELDSVSLLLKEGNNVDQYRNAISTLGTSSKCEYIKLIPLSLLICSDENYILHVPFVNHVKDNLFMNNLDICVHIEGVGYEVPFVEKGFYVEDINDKEGEQTLLSVKELQKLKAKNPTVWRQTISNIQFQMLQHQIYQVISSLNLQVSPKAISQLADKILCVVVGWNNSRHVKKLVMKAMETIFGQHDTGSFIFKMVDTDESKIDKIQCHIGSRPWGDQYGIGFTLEAIFKIQTFWKTKAQAGDDETDGHYNMDDDRMEPILVFECCLRQGFSMINSDDEDEIFVTSTFFDGKSNHDDFDHSREQAIIPDLALASVYVRLQNEFSLDNSKDIINEGNEDTGVPLSDVVKNSMHHIENNGNVFESDIFAWGHNVCGYLGIGNDDHETVQNQFVPAPSQIFFSPLSYLESVRSVACSSCHTLLLTHLGSVWSCGDGSDGQLGHNSVESLNRFQLIDWFSSHSHDRVVLKEISAGSNDTSSHSAAIDSNNNLYTWGKAILCGHNVTDEKNNKFINKKLQVTIPQRLKSFRDYDVRQISCGGGFTLVRATKRDINESAGKDRSSVVFSWGLTANGRLGLGRLKSSSYDTNETKIPWCQCNPTMIQNLIREDIIDVSAGTKHALAVTSKGDVYAWGSNSAGECSVMYTASNNTESIAMSIQSVGLHSIDQVKAPTIWDDVWVPRKITYFGDGKAEIQAKSVAAGGSHSAVVDKDGILYSWGGGGDNQCLGHGDSSNYEYGIRQQTDALQRQFNTMSGHLQSPPWAFPRIMKGLRHCKVSSVSLGGKHGAALTDTNMIYVWGKQQPDIIKGEIATNEVPTQPSATHLAKLQGKRISSVACGGNGTICVSSMDVTQANIGLVLLRESELLSSINSYDIADTIESKGFHVDCIFITGNRKIYCHKIIVASRSPKLKSMIMQEERAAQSFPEIFIAGISYAVMKHIILYLYTDSIDPTSLSSLDSLVNLLKAAKLLEIGILVSKCEHILSAVYEHKVKDNENWQPTPITRALESSFTHNLGSLFLEQNAQFADLRVTAKDDNSITFAHKCILSCSSEYFKDIILDSTNNRATHQGHDKQGLMTEIFLPGSHDDVTRLLFFLYTGVISPSASNSNSTGDKFREETYFNNNTKTDIRNAIEFQLPLMRSQYESSVIVTSRNVFDVLLFAVEVDSTRLKVLAMSKICNIMQRSSFSGINPMSWKQELSSTLSKCPGQIRAELFDMIKESKGIEAITPKSRKEIALQSLVRSKRVKEKEYQEMVEDITNSGGDILTTSRTVLLLVTFVGYYIIQSTFTVNSSITMLINIGVLLITLLYLFHIIS